jgi:hypothetical protein
MTLALLIALFLAPAPARVVYGPPVCLGPVRRGFV